jgi:preprotein translocase subunit SecF
MALEDVLNLSINETLSRTILTSSSTLLALFALYFWGGEVISTYSLPILVGVAVGTYSSIFLAAPLLKSFNFKVRKEDDKKVEFQNDQKN